MASARETLHLVKWLLGGRSRLLVVIWCARESGNTVAPQEEEEEEEAEARCARVVVVSRSGSPLISNDELAFDEHYGQRRPSYHALAEPIDTERLYRREVYVCRVVLRTRDKEVRGNAFGRKRNIINLSPLCRYGHEKSQDWTRRVFGTGGPPTARHHQSLHVTMPNVEPFLLPPSESSRNGREATIDGDDGEGWLCYATTATVCYLQ